MAEQLFASFILDREQGLEIAIAAESVTEATPISGNIQPLPASVPFLQGIMHLRNEVIPVLNLKKRLGLSESEYDKDAKIAVVILANQRFGLLFDDIREVLRVEESELLPVQPALQAGDSIISDLITLGKEHRTLEVLDLKRVFHSSNLPADQAIISPLTSKHQRTEPTPDMSSFPAMVENMEFRWKIHRNSPFSQISMTCSKPVFWKVPCNCEDVPFQS